MKLKILGTQAPFQTNGRKGVGYLVTTQDGNFMFDAGSGSHSHLTFKDYENLNLFLSHSHFDHATDVENMLYAALTLRLNKFVKPNFSIYLPEGYTDDIENRVLVADIKANDVANFTRYSEKSSVKIDGTRVDFAKTGHSSDSHAMKITKGHSSLGYTGDVGADDVDICKDLFHKADIIIAECAIPQDSTLKFKHFRPYDCARLKNLSDAKKMLLTHFYPGFPEEEHLKRCLECTDNAELALEGQEIFLKQVHT